MIAILFAPGFEEVEAIAPVDILRRAGLEVRIVGVGEEEIPGSHGITVRADLPVEAVDPDACEALVLPGGKVGTENLEASPAVQRLIDIFAARGKLIAAICAAPSILAHKGLLRGRTATSYPSFQHALVEGGAQLTQEPVVLDGPFLTAKGMGVATQFGLKLAALLTDPQTADGIRDSIQWQD